jgi:nicotinamide mononucleotide transporter
MSSVLYVWVFFGTRLYMESALNGFYAVMAAYGFWQWRHGAGGHELKVRRWPLLRHLVTLAGVVGASAINWYFLQRYTTAASPFVDSMVTWSSVFTTFLVARKVYENWYWWLIIDSVCVYLYYTRHLYATMLVYALYLLLIVVGLRAWRRSLILPAHAAA